MMYAKDSTHTFTVIRAWISVHAPVTWFELANEHCIISIAHERVEIEHAAWMVAQVWWWIVYLS